MVFRKFYSIACKQYTPRFSANCPGMCPGMKNDLIFSVTGLEQSNVIIGVDFSASNEWQGRHSFHHKSLHSTSRRHKNPYQKVISTIPKILAPFNEDNLIPTFGFADSTTKDKSVFPFKSNGTGEDIDNSNFYIQLLSREGAWCTS